MEVQNSIIRDILTVIGLVLANGFFVTAEFAIVRSHITKLKSSELKQRLGTKSSLLLLEDLDGSLSATQLGITIASLLLGWWGEVTFQKIFITWFTWLGTDWALISSHALATTAALILITFLHVVIGELAAKSLAIRYPEESLRLVAGPMLLFSKICKPVIFFLAGAANIFLKLFGVSTPSTSDRVHSSAELAMLVSQSEEVGVLDKDEKEMLHGVFSLSQTVAREVMTPRTDMVTIPSDASFKEVLFLVQRSGFSRIPVVGESVDEVLGILLTRDLFHYVSAHLFDLPNAIKTFDVRKLTREPFMVPGTKRIDDLLSELKNRKLHIALVLDEHGGVDGVVTLEDLLEEIVGEIFDESDTTKSPIKVEENGDVILDGGVLVADINSRFEAGIPEGDYDTIAGFILTLLGHVPKPADTLLVRGGQVYFIDEGQCYLLNPPEGEASGESSNGTSEGLQSVPENGGDIPETLIRIETVENNRVETVRLHQTSSKVLLESESLQKKSASQNKATALEKI